MEIIDKIPKWNIIFGKAIDSCQNRIYNKNHKVAKTEIMEGDMYTKLRKIRKENDVSAIEMANLIQLKTAAAYFKKENGHIKFSLDEAIKISRYFKMPIEAIFFDDEVAKTETQYT